MLFARFATELLDLRARGFGLKQGVIDQARDIARHVGAAEPRHERNAVRPSRDQTAKQVGTGDRACALVTLEATQGKADLRLATGAHQHFASDLVNKLL